MMAAIIAASGLFFVSCGGDDEGPMITVEVSIAGGSRTLLWDGDSINTHPAGTNVTFYYTITKGSSNLTNIYLTSEKNGNTIRIVEMDISGGMFGDPERNEYTDSHTTTVGADREKLDFEVFDKDGNRSTFTIIIDSPCTPVYVLDASPTILFGLSSTSGESFYSVLNKKVMTWGEANGASGNGVDFVYYSLEDGATIAALDDSYVMNLLEIGGWTRNRTRFVNVSIETSDNPGVTEVWWEEYVEGIDKHNPSTKVTDLLTGDIISFKTDGGIKGAFTVDDIVGQNDGHIKIKFYTKDCN